MIILGSTGSIGVNALDICERAGLETELLSAGSNAGLLQKQIEKFRPKFACLNDKERALGSEFLGAKMFYGEEGLSEALSLCKSQKALNAIVGFAGLRSTLECIEMEKEVALANKESLVAAGKFVDTSKIIPVDSEHFGLWYLNRGAKVSKMIVTASGGALRDSPLEEIYASSVKDTLKHPNWTMGRKITVDSATMANKLFELLEAYWLFGDKIAYDAVIETSSTVHAMIEFEDGVTTAQMSEPDMRLPISYALTKERQKDLFKPVDLCRLSLINFRAIDEARYPLWRLKEALLSNPSFGVALNAANEIGVSAFLDEKIAFGKIADTVMDCFERYYDVEVSEVNDVFRLDKEVREYAKRYVEA